MMMVSFDFLSEPLRFEENEVKVLCLENQKIFRSVFAAFIDGTTEENNIVFSDDCLPFKFKGNVCCLYDYFNLSYSNAIIKKLYEQMEAYCNNEQLKETIELKSHLINFMESVITAFDYDFRFNYDVSLTDLFKAVNISPNVDNSDVLNCLLDYILILNRYAPPKCFVLFNFHLFFTKEEIELFYKDAFANHIMLLLIENAKNFDKNRFEDVIIYDKDFCEIVEN